MTDRERLSELLNNFVYDIILCDTCEILDRDCAACENERLADYLLEHGVIVLPCKVGDTLYCESASKGQITYLKAPDLEWIVENKGLFGKEIFCSGEEAEQALKERESNA